MPTSRLTRLKPNACCSCMSQTASARSAACWATRAHFRLRDRCRRGEIIGPDDAARRAFVQRPDRGDAAAAAAAAVSRAEEGRLRLPQDSSGRAAHRVQHAGGRRGQGGDSGFRRPRSAGRRPAAGAAREVLDDRSSRRLHRSAGGTRRPRLRELRRQPDVADRRVTHRGAWPPTRRRPAVWNVPTQILLENWYGPDTPETMQRRPEMQHVRPAEVAQWSRRSGGIWLTTFREGSRALHRGAASPDQGAAGCRRGTAARLRRAAGVERRVLQVWNVPGFSIHRELASYVAAGLTPYQALATGTRNVAAHLGTLEPKSLGKPEARADGRLLDARSSAGYDQNGRKHGPRAARRQSAREHHRIRSRIAGVMIGGRWIPKAEIDRRLAEIRPR